MADISFLGGGKVQSNSVFGRGFGRVQITLDTEAMKREPKYVATFNLIGKAAMEYARRIVADTAFDTGELYSSIDGGTRIRNGEREAFVSVSAPHWAFVEYGTGLRGAGSSSDIAGITTPPGWRYDHKAQGWEGMEPRPYLRPAMLYIAQFLEASGGGFL